MNQMMRWGLLGLYLAALIGLLVELPFGLGPWLARLSLIILAAHVLELLAMWKHVKAYRGPLWKSVLLTLLFGLLHWLPIARASQRNTA